MFQKLLPQNGIDLGQAVKNLVAERRIQPGVGGANTILDAGLAFGFYDYNNMNINILVIN